MKSYVKIAVLLLFVLLAGESFSQTPEVSEKRNYVVITSNIAQITPIVETAKMLAKEDGSKFGELQVIICGKTVTDLVQQDKIESLVTLAEQAGVKIFACGFSLNKFKVNEDAIPKVIGVVENGLLYNFQLQKKGYLSIAL